MKKIFTLLTLLLGVVSSAFGGVTGTLAPSTKAGLTVYGAKTGTAGTTSPMIGKSSTGVGVGWFVNAGGTGYAVITQHKNGTKEFGSSYDSTSIYSCPVVTVGTPVLDVPGGITSADFIAGTWSSM